MTGKYRYRHAEAALASVFGVEADELGAFRGRLRHLRNIGVPDIPKSGSGRQIEYSRQSIIEMMLALEFEAMGVAPRYAARYAKHYIKEFAPDPDHPARFDMILVTNPHPFRFPWAAISAQSTSTWREWLLTKEVLSNRFAIVNVAQSVAVLDDALRSISA
jgi:hypothetical protein